MSEEESYLLKMLGQLGRKSLDLRRPKMTSARHV
jgi:hypothetical protein